MKMPYTEALLRSIPKLESPSHTRLEAIPGRPPDLVNPPDGLPLRAPLPRTCSDGASRRRRRWSPAERPRPPRTAAGSPSARPRAPRRWPATRPTASPSAADVDAGATAVHRPAGEEA